ncbi:hypothetical protein LOD99_10600 [Oopsacas minuta]|uniref:Uncharacterized protein n=1 Tax=Oopsacas minuta TaxID=111878 RepID=A0AAV7KIT0_9METZ|nr:hypothetical protein LOD99_10600 [Oopsacas minuta]
MNSTAITSHSTVNMSTTQITPSSANGTTSPLPYSTSSYSYSTNYTYTTTNSTITPIDGLPHWLMYSYIAAGITVFIIVLCICFFLFTCLIRVGRQRRLKQQLLPLYHMDQEYSDEEDEMLLRDSGYKRQIQPVNIQPILSFES